MAVAANVSVTTVSDSLTGKGRLPAETRERVLRIAERLGYRASTAAKNLRAARTGILLMSICTPDTDDATSWNIEFFIRVMSGASEHAFARGYALAMTPLTVSRDSSRVPCDGVVVVDPVADDHLVRRAEAERLPLVTVGRLGGHQEYVDNDIPTLVAEVLDHFAAQRARRPALISSVTDASYTAAAVAAYRRWCGRHGTEPRVVIVSGGLSEEAARTAAAELFATDPPDAILATLDSLAKGVSTAARAAGIAVPGRCLIASLADSASIAGAPIPITAVDLNPAAMGRAAAMLIDRVESGGLTGPVLIPAELRIRASSERATDQDLSY
ncbi:LacI family DNA-binding transcriptional regulator [Acrocarpospora sp. B8E8]|uniref:LacI family DNA-binding transcriptional regulator n=1 Tax=Acrocarpospora sp. B8E8 TaxID=3153572 RepID=UPI00325EA1D5